MSRKKLAILESHPIQYHAAWFRALSLHPQIDLEVLFCHRATSKDQAAAGFGVEFEWDVSLLDGYPHRFLENVSTRPSVNTFSGIDTPEIARLIEQNNYDLVVVNGWHYKSAWQAMRACWRTKTPVAARSDSHLHTSRSLTKRIVKWPFYRWFIPKLNGCLPVGKWSRDYFLHYGAQPERIFIVPHVIDDEYFSRESARWLSQRDKVRNQWGFASGATVFLFAGKFIDKKRPMDFVRAVERASRDSSQVAGLMVGDGPLRVECQEFAKAECLPITFVGFLNQSEIVKAYVAADALILPSDGRETWGLVVNEAMACGRPCWVSDQVGCGPDMVELDTTGGSFPMGEHEVLAGLLSRYAGNSDALAWMGERAGIKAQEYTVRVGVESLFAVVNAELVTAASAMRVAD